MSQKVTSSNVSYAYTYYDVAGAVSGGYAPVSGNHTIANITLKVVGVGKCSLQFSNTVLGDQFANDIPHQNNNGFFSNLAPPPPPKAALLYVDPAKIEDPNLTVSHNFTINVGIINASDLSALEFKLGFNASVLHANSVASGSFIPGSVTPITQIDNTAGFVRFNVSLSTSLTGDGNVTVVQFHVEADNVRNSTLHLYEVKLVNSTGQILPFTLTADGSFTNARALLGDLNHDDIVDISDAIMAAKAFGSHLGDNNWNPEADVAPSYPSTDPDTIDVFDLIVLASNFGHTA